MSDLIRRLPENEFRIHQLLILFGQLILNFSEADSLLDQLSLQWRHLLTQLVSTSPMKLKLGVLLSNPQSEGTEGGVVLDGSFGQFSELLVQSFE